MKMAKTFRYMVILVGLGLWTGCPIIDETSDSGVIDQPDCAVNSAGECILYNAECAPEDILTLDDQQCATCHFADEYEICGQLLSARCIDMTNAYGTACQSCVVNSTGEVLYDDCAERAVDTGTTCETVLLAPTEAVDNLTDAGPQAIDDEEDINSQKCEICSDADGQVTSFQCRPNHDACQDVSIDGRSCTECTLDGVFAYRECEPWSIDPVKCESYENDAGRCVDCFGTENEMLTHQCTLTQADSAELFCDTFLAANGVSCQKCYDLNGNVVIENCEETAPAAEYCERLTFEEQTCVLCLDQSNTPTLIDCIANTCVEGDESDCPPPPSCENAYNSDGALCRICPYTDEESDTIIQEQLCLTGGNLFCEEFTELVEQERPSNGDEDLTPEVVTVEITCVICLDEGVEVYRNCDGVEPDSLVSPPICEAHVTEVGSLSCQICYDATTNEEVFNDCPVCAEQDSAGGGTCTTCTSATDPDSIVYSDCPICFEQDSITGESCTVCSDVDDDSLIVFSDCPICVEQESGAGGQCTICTNPNDASLTVYSDCPLCEEQLGPTGTLCTSCTSASNDAETVYTDCPTCTESIDEANEMCLTCTSADDAMSVIYSDCSTCEPISLSDGSTCEECVDPTNDQVIKSDCPTCQISNLYNGATCETCFSQDTGDALFTVCDNDCTPVDNFFVLEDDLGEDLYLPNTPGLPELATPNQLQLECSGCEAIDADLAMTSYAGCALVADCPTGSSTPGDSNDSPDTDQNSADGGTTDATDASDGGADATALVPQWCEETVAMNIVGRRCNNPWGQIADGTSIAVHLMRWAIVSHEVSLTYVNVERIEFSMSCVGCSCSVGYQAEVGVPSSQANLFLDLGFSIVD
jgi:hypothetical protein